MKIHLIAIGGSVMHSLAIALKINHGDDVSGSDDEFFEPSKSRLAAAGLLPSEAGWHPERITPDIDAIILGMHAMPDNPELKRAQELGLRIYSYPEFLYEKTKDKQRIVVGGSHGKTTTTSMIMHALRSKYGNNFDYAVGAVVEGFDNMVNLSPTSKVAVFEGDEYLSSALDPSSKFLHYHPHIAITTGIAWDHINVFPVYADYVEQFRKFADTIEPSGSYIYFSEDPELQKIAKQIKATPCPYDGLVYSNSTVVYADQLFPTGVFGRHNFQNMHAAMIACERSGLLTPEEFLVSMATFKGAAKRLQTLKQTDNAIAFLDFAHSPSKVRATVAAVREQFPERKIVACLELHTFSSLNKDFLPQYAATLDEADEALVYFNPEVIEHKRLEPISSDDVRKGFQNENLKVFTIANNLVDLLEKTDFNNAVLLIMTSGNFSGVDLKALAERVIN